MKTEEKTYYKFDEFLEGHYSEKIECTVVAEWPTPARRSDNEIVVVHTKVGHMYLNTLKIRKWIAQGTIGVSIID